MIRQEHLDGISVWINQGLDQTAAATLLVAPKKLAKTMKERYYSTILVWHRVYCM